MYSSPSNLGPFTGLVSSTLITLLSTCADVATSPSITLAVETKELDSTIVCVASLDDSRTTLAEDEHDSFDFVSTILIFSTSFASPFKVDWSTGDEDSDPGKLFSVFSNTSTPVFSIPSLLSCFSDSLAFVCPSWLSLSDSNVIKSSSQFFIALPLSTFDFVVNFSSTVPLTILSFAEFWLTVSVGIIKCSFASSRSPFSKCST
ncbi:hypothetical protein Hanom_Chr03g00260691 [Helianthus anomalus]